MFEFSNNNSRIKCETCSKLTVEAADIVQVPSLLTLNIVDTFLVFFAKFEYVNAGWNTLLPYFKFTCVSESDLGAL